MLDRPAHTLMVFVDGLGLGDKDPAFNPLCRGDCPVLAGLLEGATPVDARLDVPGLPQSATGQATLLTGINAAQFLGRHAEGFPGPELKPLIREHNLFSQLQARGYAPAFANAYWPQGWTQAQRRHMQSVTTVANLAAFGQPRDTEAMLRGEAVYQDLTRETLVARGCEVPLTTPQASGRALAALASTLDFTLFEYFQTDRAAHGGEAPRVRAILRKLDEFLNALAGFYSAPDNLFIISSDHGNIEDDRVGTHTLNPVPLVALGPGSEYLHAQVHSLQDFTPALLALFPPRRPER